MGKTVLLQQMESLAVQEGWLATRHQVEPRHNEDASLATLVQDLGREARSKLSRLTRLPSAVKSVGTTAVGAVRLEWHGVALSLARPQAPNRGSDVARSLCETAARPFAAAGGAMCSCWTKRGSSARGRAGATGIRCACWWRP